MRAPRPSDTWATGVHAERAIAAGLCRYCYAEDCERPVSAADAELAAVLDVAAALREQHAISAAHTWCGRACQRCGEMPCECQ